MSTLPTSSSFSSLSLSARPFAGKSPLRGPRTPETVSQYSFHIANAAVTGLRTSALIHRGFSFPQLTTTIRAPSLLPDGVVIIYARTKAPSFVGIARLLSTPFLHLSPLLITRSIPLVFSTSSQFPLTILSLHISFNAGDRIPCISSLPSWQSSPWILRARAYLCR